MNENLKDQDSANTTGYNAVSPIGDTEKEKFMELLKNGPESENIIEGIGSLCGYIQFLLNDEYNNAMVSVNLYKKPHMVYVGKDGVGYTQGTIGESFGKKWEELAIKSLSKLHSGLRY